MPIISITATVIARITFNDKSEARPAAVRLTKFAGLARIAERRQESRRANRPQLSVKPKLRDALSRSLHSRSAEGLAVAAVTPILRS